MRKLFAALIFLPSLAWSAYQPITGSTVTVLPSTVGGFQVEPGSNTFKAAITNTLTVNSHAVTQSGVFQVEPGTNTFKASITGQSGVFQVEPGSNTFKVSGPVSQNGVFQVEPGSNTFKISGPVSQNGVFQVEPGSNTFKISGPVSGNVGIVQNTVLGATVTFNGTQPITVIGTPTIQGISSDNGAAAGTDRTNTNPGIYQTDYANGTAGTQGRNSAQDHGTDGLMWTANLPSFRPASFIASTNTVVPASSAQDISCMSGNASNTVLVYGLRVSCTETTAGNVKLAVSKRSSQFVGAWSTMTPVGMDSNYTGPVSTVTYFTANPTLGTLVADVDNYKLGCMATGTAAPNDVYIAPADWRMKPIVLRGIAQSLCVNLQGQTVTGGSFAVQWAWIETKTITP